MANTPPIRMGKITRRLFIIFVLFALLPTSVLSFLAIRFISDTTDQQISQVLSSEVENFSNQILGRLIFAEDRLSVFSQAAAKGQTDTVSLEYEKNLGLEFHIVDLASLEQETSLSAAARAHLSAGKVLSAIKTPQPDNHQVFLIKAMQPSDLAAGLASVFLSSDYILGVPDSWDLTQENCVYGDTSRVLYYTKKKACQNFATGLAEYRGPGRGTSEDTDYYLTYRSIFMAEKYGVNDWKVSTLSPEVNVFKTSEGFRNLFLALSVLVILSISLVSIYLIRRQMSPLSVIMAGIQRVSHRDYNHEVDVNSGDEFEEMAQAFNSMSGRVSHQLLTLASMSEIDQLILSRVKKEDIIQIVLQKTRLVLPGDHTSILMLEKGEFEGRLFQLDDQDSSGMHSQAVALSEPQRQRALRDSNFYLSRSDGSLPEYIQDRGMALAFYQILPIRKDSELIALIILGFKELCQLDGEQISLALSYAGRIAVALSNAEWEDKLYTQAHYDSLTGLPNRATIIDQLGHSISRSRRATASFGVLFIDLDNFKLINDSLGHSVGDRFIQEMGRRFSTCLREGDMVARLGGDEFVIISAETRSSDDTVSAISRIADRILQATAEAMTTQGHELRTTATIGIALYPKDGNDSESLLKNADAAMYHAKSIGRGSFQFYSEELNAQSLELIRLSSELKVALEEDQFEPYYQPKVNIGSEKIVGAEALIRWRHPEKGLVGPGLFIDAAESLGLINAMGDWMLRSVCRQIGEWKAAGLVPPRISINVSASQMLQEDMFSKVSAIMAETNIEGSDIELEITEGVLVTNMNETIDALTRLRDLGIHISIDDFGTGYSSLSYMKQLPVNTLKIDRCFIVDLCTDFADKAIVNSTIVLARNLNMKVIAEGVEDADQVEVLRDYGCDEIQGFFYSRPVPANDFVALVLGNTDLDNRTLAVS